MARPVNEDPYQNYRFQVVDPQGKNISPDAGFTIATTPNVTLTPVEYREGTYTWTRKFPGVPTVGDLSLSQGIFRRNSEFFDWILRVIQGGNREYRTELIVNQYHQQDEFGLKGTPSRITRLLEVFPTDVKPTNDFGGDDDAVSITDATFAVEEIQVELLATTSTPPTLAP
jgi:phage tail-like protein